MQSSSCQFAPGLWRLIAEASHDLLTRGVGADAFRNARIGAWRVDGLLGEGGMGMVFLAHRDDGRFEQTAAIKLLRLTLAGPADLARFHRERRILARLGHPHIARLLDAGEHPIGRGLEIPYFVMEHVAGTPLTRYARDHALTSRQRVELYQQVLDAVGYAHQHLVLHRDVKPENILVTADGVVKLLDFGIAQLLEGDPSGPDHTRSTLMTPDYASPEQLRGDPLTVQSDVFTLGALLYELLSGRRAYDAGGSTSPTERAMAMAAKPAADLGIDGDLDTIVAKAIHMTDRLATVMGNLDHPNLGDPAAAAALYEVALAQVERVAAADPQDVRARRDLAEMHASYAATLRDTMPARARDGYARALEIYRTLPDSLTRTPTVARWLAEHERGLAVSLAHLSRMDLAWPHLEHALAEFRRLDVPQPTGVALTDMAEWRTKSGELREARRAAEQAITSLERAWKDQSDDISLRRDLGAAYATMARIVARTDGCASGREWLQRSEWLWREVAGTEAAAYGERELTKLAAAAPGCG